MKGTNPFRKEYASNSDFPCKPDCEKRCVGCHATCKEYIDAKKVYDEKQAKIRAKKDAENDVKVYVVDHYCSATGKPYKQR